MVEKEFYLFVRVLQSLALLCLTGLEITQLILFKNQNDTIVEKPTSWEAFENFYKQHGIKYFHYAVIIITLIYILYDMFYFTSRWKLGPHIRKESFFLLLWLAVGFSIIYPIFLNKSKLECNLNDFQNGPAKITECRIYITNMAIIWFIVLLFLVTTISSIYLLIQRNRLRNQIVRG
ncbi:hypothetical protein C1645_820290 [Glomus cerebriforme]|uniref:MARVEL domain-containing protein n=1 Tax=Glomus cerebriforme TaxID=658196 RepID=A0A397T8M1_9GLOM|nr:hypothetical protein C1645_820290 [Glomus cerebriforme]